MSVFQRLLNGSRGCTDLLRCVYELNQLETAAYVALLDREGARMEELTDLLDRDRSTVHRAVQRLLDLQLAERETVPMRGGGYYHRYRATSPDKVRQLVEARLKSFEDAVRSSLDSFEEDLYQKISENGTEQAA